MTKTLSSFKESLVQIGVFEDIRKLSSQPREAAGSQILGVCSQLWIPSPLICSYHLEWSVPSETARLQKGTLVFFHLSFVPGCQHHTKSSGWGTVTQTPSSTESFLQGFELGAHKCLSCPLLLLCSWSCLYSTSLCHLRHLPRVWKGFTSNSSVSLIWS